MVWPVAKVSAPDQAFRRERLLALLNHPDFGGNKAALGRALALESGAYIRQMIAGDRPITEKTIEAVHTVKGCKFAGWFARSGDAAPRAASAAWPLGPFVSAERWEMLSPEQRGAVAYEASKLVNQMLEPAHQAPASAQSQKRRAGDR
jgi:hypothetical protein